MSLTEDQKNAYKAMCSGYNVLLTGGAGTGKTYLINIYCQTMQAKGKTVLMAASTGIAAHLVGGRTIHSLLKYYPQMSMDNIDYDAKVEHIKEADVLVIDEISMLSATFMQYLYLCLQHIDHHIQLILMGDFYQLPPVKSAYAFQSSIWDCLDLHPCILSETVRQTDPEFVHNLNLLRKGDIQSLHYFNENTSDHAIKHAIYLCARSAEAKEINLSMIQQLTGETIVYHAHYEGVINFNNTPLEKCLIIRANMRVMTLINDSKGHYQNGSMGTVISANSDTVRLMLDNGTECFLGYISRSIERTDIPGAITTITQIPLKPAYAVTIHKSQGQTFDAVNILGSKCWDYGQLYVALSRARYIDKVYLADRISSKNLRVSSQVLQFYDRISNTSYHSLAS